MKTERYLLSCIVAAEAGAKSIADYKPATEQVKESSHHAIVTDADLISQQKILEKLMKTDEDFSIIVEELLGTPPLQSRLITADQVERIRKERVYVIDELDGTAGYRTGHHEWSVSVGYLEFPDHKAGAVYAPKIGNGTLFFADEGGSFVRNTGLTSHTYHTEQAKVGKRENLRECYVLSGVDLVRKKYPHHNKLLIELGDIARTINMCGSCALGLGLVASGRADALVQSPQYVQDWAAGKLLVERAGGTMLFYEQQDKKLVPVDELEPRHYTPGKKTVGFVAGNEKVSKQILDLLLQIEI
jgi:myo-inositol-1(or 4)-monophosphatase